jgi:hypothetical protein
LQCWKDKILHPHTKYERVTTDELVNRLNPFASKDAKKVKFRVKIPEVTLTPPSPPQSPDLPQGSKERRIVDENTVIWDGKRLVWDKDFWNWVDTSLDGIPEDVPVQMECGLTVVRSGDHFVLVDETEAKPEAKAEPQKVSKVAEKDYLRVPNEDW